jgi:hypothetical protein
LGAGQGDVGQGKEELQSHFSLVDIKLLRRQRKQQGFGLQRGCSPRFAAAP